MLEVVGFKRSICYDFQDLREESVENEVCVEQTKTARFVEQKTAALLAANCKKLQRELKEERDRVDALKAGLIFPHITFYSLKWPVEMTKTA